jgi:hypothetical protein
MILLYNTYIYYKFILKKKKSYIQLTIIQKDYFSNHWYSNLQDQIARFRLNLNSRQSLLDFILTNKHLYQTKVVL